MTKDGVLFEVQILSFSLFVHHSKNSADVNRLSTVMQEQRSVAGSWSGRRMN